MHALLLVANVIGFQGILRYRLTDAGSSLGAEELEPMLQSRDPNFRPADLKVGPDGALYFCDWQNPIIGHMQHNLRDPSRDRTHGRIYKVTADNRELALLFRTLATLRADLPLIAHAEELRWTGETPAFLAVTERFNRAITVRDDGE